jgi:DNA-binding LacI/PurR family transcriptional regulator
MRSKQCLKILFFTRSISYLYFSDFLLAQQELADRNAFNQTLTNTNEPENEVRKETEVARY